MITGLLVLLNVQLACVVAYAISERFQATKYRRLNIQAQRDGLFFDDLMARLEMSRGRSGRGFVVTGLNGDRDQTDADENGGKVAAHGSSFPGWDKP